MLLTACERRPTASPVSSVTDTGPLAPAHVDTSPLHKFECNRCHVIEGIKPTTVNMDCRECHRQIILGTYPEPAQYLAMWDKGLENMRDVPSLFGARERFTREWFVEFVQRPHDLRPRLGATMPRLAISTVDAEALAAALQLEPARDSPLVGDAARGRELVDTKGCGACHVMSGLVPPIAPSAIPVEVTADQLARATQLAPDLRHARTRFHRAQLAGWLRHPNRVKRDALMPDVGLNEEQANDVAAFLLAAELTDLEPVTVPQRLPPLKRDVRWKEVQEKLVDEICLHCHSDPKYNDGDGGPGNTGGFGYAGKKLDMSSYERAVRDRSFYAPGVDGAPKIVAHMMARHEEVAGRVAPILGMPLGFPPIDPARIQLLESWIVQGLKE